MAMGLLTTIGAHGFGRMAYTLILPAMKDGLQFTYAQLGLLATGNFIGYLSLAIIGGFLASRFGTRIVISLGPRSDGNHHDPDRTGPRLRFCVCDAAPHGFRKRRRLRSGHGPGFRVVCGKTEGVSPRESSRVE